MTNTQRKVVLITGASRGIGRASALLAAARGWSVGINYARDAAAAEATADAVRAAGAQACVVRGDVAHEADVIHMFDAVQSAFGRLDALVNNAGIVAPSLPLADMDIARLKRVFDTNVLGAYLCAREAARRLSTDRGGCRPIAAAGAARSSTCRRSPRGSARRTSMSTMRARRARSTR